VGAEIASVRVHTWEDLVVYASPDAPRAAEALVHPAASALPGLTQSFFKHPLLKRAPAGALTDPRVVKLEAKRAADLPALLSRAGRFDLIAVEAWAPLGAVRWLLSPQVRPFFAAHLEPGGYRVGLPASIQEQYLFELSSAKPFDLSWLRGLRVPTGYLTEAHLRQLFVFGRDEDYQTTERTGPCASELGIVDG
jgi:hypothetical protein